MEPSLELFLYHPLTYIRGSIILPITKLATGNCSLVVGLVILFAIFLLIHAFGPMVKLMKTGLPYPRPVYPFFGNFFTIYRKGFQEAQVLWHRSLGRCYAVAQSQTVVIVLSDPELLKQVLVKKFPTFINRRTFPIVQRVFRRSLFMSHDEEWRWARHIILPTFTSHKIKSHMFPLMKQCAEKLSGHLNDKIKKSTSGKNTDRPNEFTTFNAKDHFGCFTMDVIASTAFGLDLDSYQDKNNIFVKNAKKSFEFEAVNPLFAFLTVFPWIAKMLSYVNFNLIDPAPMEFFIEVIKETIAKRRTLKIKRNDYLQLLLESNDAFIRASSMITDNKISGNIQNGYNSKLSGKEQNGIIKGLYGQQDDNRHMAMTEQEDVVSKPYVKIAKKNMVDGVPINPSAIGFSEEDVIGNALLFFLAGYETTANSLSWIARMLAWYPDIQDRVKEELRAKIRHRSNAIESLHSTAAKNVGYFNLTYEDIMDLPYMDCVIKEVLRLHPPILIFDRVASEDTILTGGKYSMGGSEGEGSNKTKGSTNVDEGSLFIKKGTIIEIPVYALHRDEDFWSDPDAFNPGRFMNDRGNTGIDYQYQYMPFGYGPRNCVGLRFALLEIKVGLAAIFGSGLKFVPALGDCYKDLTPNNTKFRVAGLNFPKAGIFVGLAHDDEE